MTVKIRQWAELKEVALAAKNDGKIVGFTNGCFDILHVGHVQYLQAAKKNVTFLSLV